MAYTDVWDMIVVYMSIPSLSITIFFNYYQIS